MTLAGGATYLGFSADTNRFIYGQRDNTIVTYDLELVSSARITALANPHATRGVDRCVSCRDHSRWQRYIW